ETGDVDQVFYGPRMPYTLGLLGSLPRLDATRSHRLTPIVGTPPSLVNLPSGCPFSPRCPIVQPSCIQEEPDLFSVGVDAQLAACDYHQRVSAALPVDLFHPTTIDEELVAS